MHRPDPISTRTRPGLEVAGALRRARHGHARHRLAPDRCCRAPTAHRSRRSTRTELAHFAVCAGEDSALEGQTMPLSETLGEECLRRDDVTVLRATTGPEVEPLPHPGRRARSYWYRSSTTARCAASSACAAPTRTRSIGPTSTRSACSPSAPRSPCGTPSSCSGSRRASAPIAALHAQAADAALVTDEGRILDANEEAATLLGYSVNELRGLSTPTSSRTASRSSAAAPIAPTGSSAAGTAASSASSTRRASSRRPHASRRSATSPSVGAPRTGCARTSGRLHAIVETQQQIAALELDFDAVTSAIVEPHAAPLQRRRRGRPLVRGLRLRRHPGGRNRRGPRSETASTVSSSLSGIAALTGEVVSVPDAELDTRINVGRAGAWAHAR